MQLWNFDQNPQRLCTHSAKLRHWTRHFNLLMHAFVVHFRSVSKAAYINRRLYDASNLDDLTDIFFFFTLKKAYFFFLFIFQSFTNDLSSRDSQNLQSHYQFANDRVRVRTHRRPHSPFTLPKRYISYFILRAAFSHENSVFIYRVFVYISVCRR